MDNIEGDRIDLRSRALHSARLSWPLRYATALPITLLVAALQHLIFPRPSIAPFVLFTAGVALTSWLGGLGPGVVATVLSAMLGNYLFMAPYNEFTVTGPALLATGLFILAGTAIASLSGLLQKANDEAERKARLLDVVASEQRQAAAALRGSEEKLRAVLDATPFPIAVVDVQDDQIEFWSRSALDLFGHTAATASEWYEMAYPDPEYRRDVVARWKPFLEIARETRRPVNTGEYQVTCRDGSTRTCELHAAFLPGNLIVTFNDVTERRRAEDALRLADQRKDEFLAVLSHELRNPLAPIRNGLYILQRTEPGGEQARRAEAVIDRQVSHLARLVDDLLDVTRIRGGKIRLQHMRLDLVDVVRRTLDDHRSTLQGHEVAIELPQEPLWMDGDPTRLAQIIGNLLTNAAKFTPAEGKISVSLQRALGRAVIEVTDTGVGIDADTLQRLFEPFAQADRSLDRSRGGLGLGLTLVKGLVELHRGEVSAHSAGAGKGARFSLTFPLDDQTAPAPALRVPRDEAGDARRRVLVIEDNRDAADTLVEALALSGHRVMAAYDGETGLARAREFRPAVVLCDIGLPAGMDGYAVARSLRRDPLTASTYLVALTGYAQPEDKRRALDAGFHAHLAKPPDLQVLERLLAQASGDGTQTGIDDLA